MSEYQHIVEHARDIFVAAYALPDENATSWKSLIDEVRQLLLGSADAKSSDIFGLLALSYALSYDRRSANHWADKAISLNPNQIEARIAKAYTRLHPWYRRHLPMRASYGIFEVFSFSYSLTDWWNELVLGWSNAAFQMKELQHAYKALIADLSVPDQRAIWVANLILEEFIKYFATNEGHIVAAEEICKHMYFCSGWTERKNRLDIQSEQYHQLDVFLSKLLGILREITQDRIKMLGRRPGE